jgi:hypothetical protein
MATILNDSAATDQHGIIHPIRGTEGYSGVLLRQREKEREQEGLTSVDQQTASQMERYDARQRGSTVKAERLAEKVYQLREERDALKEDLDGDPAAELTAFIGEHGKARSERGLIPFGEVRKLGIRPEKYRTAVVQQGPHQYLKWEYFLDDLAPERGYDGADDLLEGIRRARGRKKHLAELDRRIADAEKELRGASGRPDRRNPSRDEPSLLERFLAWLSR